MTEWVQRQGPHCCGSRSIDGPDAWLTAKFSRLLELRAQDPGPFNYPLAVFSEWRGKAFYLLDRARSRRPEDDFVVRHTRMTLAGFGRFDLACFRHTDKWFTVHRGLTARNAFARSGERDLLADDLMGSTDSTSTRINETCFSSSSEERGHVGA